MLDNPTCRDLSKRLERLAPPFLSETDIGFNRFLDEPSPRPVNPTGEAIQLLRQFRRQVRRHDPGCHINHSESD